MACVTGNALLHTLPCPAAAHVDVTVVRIPHEAVLALLQSPVKFVEHRFDSSGDNGPPCGVPSSTGPTSPLSIPPAVRNARINLSTLLSATRRATAAISFSWLTRSKNFPRI